MKTTCGIGCKWWNPTININGRDEGYCYYNPARVARDRKDPGCHHHPHQDITETEPPREIGLLRGPGSIGIGETEKQAILRYIIKLERQGES